MNDTEGPRKISDIEDRMSHLYSRQETNTHQLQTLQQTVDQQYMMAQRTTNRTLSYVNSQIQTIKEVQTDFMKTTSNSIAANEKRVAEVNYQLKRDMLKIEERQQMSYTALFEQADIGVRRAEHQRQQNHIHEKAINHLYVKAGALGLHVEHLDEPDHKATKMTNLIDDYQARGLVIPGGQKQLRIQEEEDQNHFKEYQNRVEQTTKTQIKSLWSQQTILNFDDLNQHFTNNPGPGDPRDASGSSNT